VSNSGPPLPDNADTLVKVPYLLLLRAVTMLDPDDPDEAEVAHELLNAVPSIVQRTMHDLILRNGPNAGGGI
jgi:hypothetical protein